MNIWITNASEVTPIDRGQRPLRVGLLSEILAQRGHQVTWWTSSFDHITKRQRNVGVGLVTVRPGLALHILQGCSYPANVDLRRVFNHWQLGYAFRRAAAHASPPDMILCSWPTMEMAFFAVEYAKAKDVPVVIDIRDLWPDILADVLPVWSRPLGRVALLPFEMMAHRALSSCTAITAVSEGYLNWGLGKTARARSELDRVFPLGYSNPEDSTRGALLDGSDLRSRFGLEPDKLTVWFLGTFGQTYDLETVIGAASILAQSGAHDIQFVLSGDGEQRGALERKARNLKNVIFTDWVDRAGILSLMKVAGIGLAAYRVGAPQGISNKIIEYMAAGLPIVSSLRGEAEELIEQRKLGLNYEPGNCRSLANVLQTLGRDRALRMTFAANSRSEYDSHYRADTVYGKMADYLEFVARHGRGGLRREVNGG